MKNYNQLVREFKYKVKRLQSKCKHEKSIELKGDYWLMGYPKNRGLKVCNFCKKMLIGKKKRKNE